MIVRDVFDVVVIAGSLGALLDPSADERGVTAKLGIDATRPFGASPRSS